MNEITEAEKIASIEVKSELTYDNIINKIAEESDISENEVCKVMEIVLNEIHNVIRS